MPMSALTTPMVGSTTTAPATTASSSDGVGAIRLRHPRPDRLGVAPDRLVAVVPGDPPRRGPTARCRRAGSDRPSTGRSAPASRRRESRVIGRPLHRTGRGRPPSSSPGAQRSDAPAGRSRRNPAAADRSNASRGSRDRTGRCDETRTTRRDWFRTAIVRRSRSTTGRSSAVAITAPGPRGSAGASPPSGSTRTTSRVPSARSTSRRTSSTSSRTPSRTSTGARAPRPAASTPSQPLPVPSRLEHRVADDRDRLGGIEPEAAGAAAPGQLGGREQEEALLLPGGQAHRSILDRGSCPISDGAATRGRAVPSRAGKGQPATAAASPGMGAVRDDRREPSPAVRPGRRGRHRRSTSRGRRGSRRSRP